MHIDAVKCVQRQVQQTLSEVQVIVNAEFEATISARVSPIIVLKVFLVERLGDRSGVLLGLDDGKKPVGGPPPLQVVLEASNGFVLGLFVEEGRILRLRNWKFGS